MTPSTGGVRYRLDYQSQTALVLPDQVGLTCKDKQVVPAQRLTQFTYAALWQCSQRALAAFQKSRPIVLTDTIISLDRPTLPDIKYFSFATTGPLSGMVVIGIAQGSEAAVVNSLKNDSSLMHPRYRGTTEYFSQQLELAKCEVSTTEQQTINNLDGGLATQAAALINYIEATVSDKRLALQLADQLIDNYCKVVRDAAGPTPRWRLLFSAAESIIAHLTTIQMLNDVVSGDATNVTVTIVDCA